MQPRQTPMHAWHLANGGKLTDFAGWSLPVQYQAGLIAEHLATRKAGGVFDICHMGRFLVEGPAALAFLEQTLSNRAGRLAPGQAQYTLISTPDGFPIDDAFLYRLAEERFLLVVNAANCQAAWDWLNRHNQAGALLGDASQHLGMIAVQGPASESLLAGILSDPLPPAGRNRGAWNRWQGKDLFLARTGYTGEPVGFELFPAWENTLDLWRELVGQGEPAGVAPVGLGARDTLRLEAGLPLYGHEYARQRPIMAVPTARLGVDLSEERGEFIGRQALARQAAGLAERIYAVAGPDKGMMREGSPVFAGGVAIGQMTSATTVPAWRFAGGVPSSEHYLRPLGLALLQGQVQIGQEVEIQYRKRTLAGRVVRAFARPAGDYLQPVEQG